jgi:hypothetical protein
MKLLFGFILSVFTHFMYAQNLVPNSSFEQNIDCSTPVLRNAAEWCSVGNNFSYLYSCESNPHYQTPYQYLNSCIQSYQIPKTGQAYAAFYTYIVSSTLPPNKFAQVKLIDTLKSSKIYCVSFYLSLWNYSQYSTDKIGAVLTPTPFPCLPPATAPNYTVTGVTPQIVSPAGVQLNDTLNWMEVSGTYTANGTEAYLTIGDFYLQSQHSVVQSYPTNCNGVADYYLDDVSVEEVEIAKAKNDTLIYVGDSTIIGNNASEAALFSWQPATGLSCTICPNPKASPNVTTTYTVTKTQCKAVTSDVITITVSPTGLTEEEQLVKNLFIYPNPSKDKINIKVNTTATEQFYIKLTDVLGKEIMYDKFKTELDISSLQNGIYFLSFYKNNQLLVTKKVVKQ